MRVAILGCDGAWGPRWPAWCVADRQRSASERRYPRLSSEASRRRLSVPGDGVLCVTRIATAPVSTPRPPHPTPATARGNIVRDGNPAICAAAFSRSTRLKRHRQGKRHRQSGRRPGSRASPPRAMSGVRALDRGAPSAMLRLWLLVRTVRSPIACGRGENAATGTPVPAFPVRQRCRGPPQHRRSSQTPHDSPWATARRSTVRRLRALRCALRHRIAWLH